MEDERLPIRKIVVDARERTAADGYSQLRQQLGD